MGEAKRTQSTLQQQLALLEENMEEMKEQMIKDGMPPVSIVYAARVLLPAFQTMLQAHHTKVPIPDIDEAVVSTISSLLFDYMQRIHTSPAEALDHFNLVGQDVSERVIEQIKLHIKGVDVPALIVPPTRH